jgi:hypothetical protein
MQESAVVGRRLSFIAILAGALVLASCGSNSVPAVMACLKRVGFHVYQSEVYEPPQTRGGYEPWDAGLEGGLTVNESYFVYIWDSQGRARSFAKEQGDGYDVIGTAVAGPFSFPAGVPLPKNYTSKADRAKIDSCLQLSHA